MPTAHRPPFSYKQAAEYVNLSQRQLERLVAADQIPFVTMGPRSIRFLPDALDAWLLERSRNLESIRTVVEASRAAQGLPPTVEDPLILGTVAEMLRANETPDVADAPDAA